MKPPGTNPWLIHDQRPAHEVRYIEYNGGRYLRLEDMVEYLRTLAATEDTDTRNRLNAAADNLSQSTRIDPSP